MKKINDEIGNSYVHTNQVNLETKEFWTVAEFASYLGVSKSCIYKLPESSSLNKYKPSPKLLLFKSSEILRWINSSKFECAEDIIESTAHYLNRKDNVHCD